MYGRVGNKVDVPAFLNEIDWWFPPFLLQYEVLHYPDET